MLTQIGDGNYYYPYLTLKADALSNLPKVTQHVIGRSEIPTERSTSRDHTLDHALCYLPFYR